MYCSAAAVKHKTPHTLIQPCSCSSVLARWMAASDAKRRRAHLDVSAQHKAHTLVDRRPLAPPKSVTDTLAHPILVPVDAAGVHEAHKDGAAHPVPEPAADPHAHAVALAHFALPPGSRHVGTQAGVQLSTTHQDLHTWPEAAAAGCWIRVSKNVCVRMPTLCTMAHSQSCLPAVHGPVL